MVGGSAADQRRRKERVCAWNDTKGKVMVMRAVESTSGTLAEVSRRWWVTGHTKVATILRSTKGQGTTEYAILVGVLVVIAILAIMVFRPKLQELWNAIADGINGL